MSTGPSSHDRRLELLAERALFGLSPEDQRELERLGVDDSPVDDLALAAAALDLCLHGQAMAHETLPAPLQQRTLDAVRKTAVEDRKAMPSVVPIPVGRRVVNNAPRRDWLGWAVAAAAIAVAAFSFTRQPDLREESPMELRSKLIAASKHDPGSVFQSDWTVTEDPAAKGASGKLIWSNKLQRGVMEFSGVEVNDPTKEQYQLWIFDADRPEATPVDGGVFNIPSDTEIVLIPIDARLPIAKPTLFAITVEKPGGVVVSDRERLPLIAPVPNEDSTQ
ncbi:anti-sigma factor [Lacipirellula parvula]|uniref:Anti-sigma K factor RskA C-terminal domain-containing protein n=1 Tax=Lacipirellula parvula TaxID=2650471 RepID=A0A5K7XA15_9BACT|nr:anti-sigma factor [Lacipirellula parvula]BBO33398.1 hypothetical protein PLANPX_3010 [Lacipirellula parvula]